MEDHSQRCPYPPSSPFLDARKSLVFVLVHTPSSYLTADQRIQSHKDEVSESLEDGDETKYGAAEPPVRRYIKERVKV
ncbi:hypothetical protein Taro_044727 [Colocasia esculenta]|uniref:Uncharacterized protein n=1 Tax=Colocasia esculenta TaxID=4460 RepID=A0A843WK00_COLES|nr:hypothetical protein [Colocasia esculenta]